MDVKTTIIGSTSPVLELELQWNEANPAAYAELTYDLSGNVSSVDLYSSPSKTIHIFSKTFSYTGSDLTEVTLTRISDGASIIKTISYVGGKISTVSRTYTP